MVRDRTAAVGVLAAAFFYLGLLAGAEANEIGKAASVVPATDITRGTIVRTLTINEALEQDDRIRTSSKGATQVRFLDDTMLTIGPDSEVLLDKFVYDGTKVQNLSVEVVRGAMRFVSGTSNREAYTIKTPVATIGVRGTVVDILVQGGQTLANFVDGSGFSCLTSGGGCKDFTPGGPGFSIGLNGFSPLSATEAAKLKQNTNTLDGAHSKLSQATGHQGNEASGAAAGQGSTGSTGGGTGGQGGGSGGEGSGGGTGGGNTGGGGLGSGDPIYTPPPCLNCTTTPTLPTGTGTGPAFPIGIDVFRITGTGGPDSQNGGPNLEDGLLVRNDYLFVQRSPTNPIWDSNNTDLRSTVIQRSLDPNDPFTITFSRPVVGGAQVTGNQGLPGGYVGVDANGTPIYYLASFTNGRVDFTSTGGGATSGHLDLNQNQYFSILGWGFTGSLFSSPANFGTNVAFKLEAWTPPTRNDGLTAPGTFSGHLGVGLGTTMIRYGMDGTVVMPSLGTFYFETPGGVANPHQSNAIAPLIGDIAGSRAQSNVPSSFTPLSPATASYCGTSPNCNAELHFSVLYPGRVGVTYFINSGNFGSGPEIQGIATFAQVGSAAQAPIGGPPSPGAALVSFTDVVGGTEIMTTGNAHGVVEVGVNDHGVVEPGATYTALKEVYMTDNNVRIRGSATSQDIGGVPGLIGWERWAGGTIQVSTNGGDLHPTFTDVDIPADGGLHFVHGLVTDPTTLPSSANWNPGANVQYSLVGWTHPTLASGGVAPGTLSPDSRLGVNFSGTPRVGVDLRVNIDNADYRIRTAMYGAYGAGTNDISVTGSGSLFSTFGRSIPVNVSGVVGSNIPCTSGNCTAGITGFFAGNGTDGNNGPNMPGEAPPYAGLNYTFGNTSTTILVSGAAAFGRNMPIVQAAAVAYIDPTDTSGTGLFASLSTQLPTRANASTEGVPVTSDTPTGLAVQFLNLNLGDGSNFINFQRIQNGPTQAAQVVDQGSINTILGWERWTNGNVQVVQSCNSPSSCPVSNITLGSNQGMHLLYGVPTANVPTTGTADYNLTGAGAGATRPTVANGLTGPGTLTGNMHVDFNSGASRGVTANLNVQMPLSPTVNETYHVQNSTPMALQGPQFSSSNGITGFTIPVTPGTLCPSGGSGCNASIGGFLAGNNAQGLGIFYQIGNMTNATTRSTAISGAAGFRR